MAGNRDAFTGFFQRFIRCHPKTLVLFCFGIGLFAFATLPSNADEKNNKSALSKISENQSKENKADKSGPSKSTELKFETAELKSNDSSKDGSQEKDTISPIGKSDSHTDILTLLDEGKVTVKLQAEGAYKLHVKIKNETNETINVKFPAGLVADAFAQNQLFRQVGSGETGQGMGLLNTPQSPVVAGGEVSFNIRSCCLNYGVPEPRRHTPLFLKSIQDYTPNRDVHRVLKTAAANETPTPVAQAALWHYTNNLSWDRLTKVGPGVGLVLSEIQMKDAKFLSGESSVSMGTELANIAPQPVQSQQVEKLKPVAIAINPDPRSIQASSTAVRKMVRTFREVSPTLDVSYRNFSAVPAKQDSGIVQWHVLVKAFDTNNNGMKKPSLFTIQRTEWDPKSNQWHYDKPFVAKTPKGQNDETPNALCQRLMADIADRSLQISYNKAKGEIKVVNLLPAEVVGLSIRAKKTDETSIVLKDVAIPTGIRGTVIKLCEADQEKLSNVVKPSACGFEIRS